MKNSITPEHRKKKKMINISAPNTLSTASKEDDYMKTDVNSFSNNNNTNHKDNNNNNTSSNSISFATRGVRSIILFNIFQKLLTFATNQIIIRHSSPEIFGVAAVQLELLLSTLLFLSREGIRLAMLRSVIHTKRDLQQLVNISSIPALIVLLFSTGIYIFCPSIIGGMSRSVVLLYCGGAFFESLGEPLYNIYNQTFRVDFRLKADATAVTMRSLVTYIAVVYCDLGVVGFGIAQMCFGIIHVLTLFSNYNKVTFTLSGEEAELGGYTLRLTDLLPKYSSLLSIPSSKKFISNKQNIFEILIGVDNYKNSISMIGTSLLKHCLTEADKIVLSVFGVASHYDQGVYGVINNYGSLVARMIFQPVEEMVRLSFSKMAASAKYGHESNQNQIVVKEVLNMSNLISIILKTVGLFSLLFPVFGPNYSRLAVQYGLGSRWYKEETVTSLAVYCLYILVLGMNGVSEAFVYSTSSAGVVSTVNISLATSSVVFCFSSVALIARIGTSGILVANILSMSVRIVFNLFYIHKYFNSIPEKFPSKMMSTSNKNDLKPLRDACIHSLDVGGMILVFSITYVSSTRYASSLMTIKDTLLHLSVGGGCFLLLIIFFYKLHKEEIFKMISTLREYKSDKKIN